MKKYLTDEEVQSVVGGVEYITYKYYILISYWKNGAGTSESMGPYDTRDQALNAGLLCSTIKYDQGYRSISYCYMYIGESKNFVGQEYHYPAA